MQITQSEQINIVLINGWAMPGTVWGHFRDELNAASSGYALSAIVDLHVVNIDRSLSLDQWVEYLDELILPNTWLMGWSLGGMLAVEYAARRPGKLNGLCTLQMNPKFVQSFDWSFGMEASIFAEFQQLVKNDINRLVKRFGFLVTAKGVDALGDLKQLKKQFFVDNLYPSETLISSLRQLETLDVRGRLAELKIPQLHIYGEQDQLVPVEASQQVKKLLPKGNGRGAVALIPEISHYPCGSAASRLIKQIHQFIGE